MERRNVAKAAKRAPTLHQIRAKIANAKRRVRQLETQDWRYEGVIKRLHAIQRRVDALAALMPLVEQCVFASDAPPPHRAVPIAADLSLVRIETGSPVGARVKKKKQPAER